MADPLISASHTPTNSTALHVRTPFSQLNLPFLDDASMQPSRLFLSIALLLAPVALIGTTWLYLYPIFHGCAFPKPPLQDVAPFRLLALGDPQLEGDSSLPDPNAPVFPSLEHVVQDLQLAIEFRKRLDILKDAAKGATKDALKWLEGKRKAIDLWGNDYYLAHIVRSVRWWSEPTHISVLGDLLGSQWITDGEFEKRAGRYWDKVMHGLEKVPARVYGQIEEDEVEEQAVGEEAVEEIEPSTVKDSEEEVSTDDAKDVAESTHEGAGEAQADEGTDKIHRGNLAAALEAAIKSKENKGAESEDQPEEQQNVQEESTEEKKALRKPTWGGTTEVLGADAGWATRVINIAGNHDVGYAGDLDESRVARFEKAFGSVNWDIWFTLPLDLNVTGHDRESAPEPTANDTPPALRIVVLNSMNIDTPAWSYDLQTETYSFMNHIITTARPVQDKTHATIILTHIPLEKQAGVCVDSPLFAFFEDGQGVREQNMLSDHSSKTILEGIFGLSDYKFAAGGGMGRRGIILNGHDHEGCDVVHFIRQEGVPYGCDPETLKKGDAYWPAPRRTITTTSSDSATGTMEGLVVEETSSANMTNPFLNEEDHGLSPAPLLERSTESTDPEPEPEFTGWRAHRFPHRPFDVTYDPVSNTSSCTHISSAPHVREITLRSMMGDFSGHAGFLSAWFDRSLGDKGEWTFEFNSCGLGVQHWWWAVHSIDFSLFVMLFLAVVCTVHEKCKDARNAQAKVGSRGNSIGEKSIRRKDIK